MPRLTVAVMEGFQRSDSKKISDTQQRGLVVRKKAGWPSFYLRTQVSGGDVLFLLGAWRRELEIEEARRFASDLLYDLQRGVVLDLEYIAKKRVALGLDSEVVAPSSRPLFMHAQLGYLEHVRAERAPATYSDYSRALREPLLEPLHDKPIDRVTREDLAEIVDAISKSCRQRSAEKLAVILSGMWNWMSHDANRRTYGVEAGMLHRFKPIKRKGTTISKHEPSPDEIAAVLDGGLDGASETMRAATTLLLLTGQRITTIATARREHFSVERFPGSKRTVRVWRMPSENLKSKRPHSMPIPDRAWWIVERVKEGWLFPADTPSGHIYPGSLTHLFGHRFLDLGFTPHSVRTALATAVRSARLGREAPKLILDHAEGRAGDVTLQHYDFYEEMEEKETILNAWITAIDKAMACRRQSAA
ncbi:MAG: hypothetical protein VYD57_11330 [Pseudomonadota bacterium]|nr:hypothetical protein [Pseudomonadota bacterium]